MTLRRPGAICLGLGLLVAALASGCGRRLPPDYAPNLARAEKIRSRMMASVTTAGGGGGGPVLPDPTGWGTLAGTIKVNGTVAGLSAVIPDKDVQVCGTSAPNETVVVGPGGGLKNVLVYLDMKLPADEDLANPKWEHPDYIKTRTATLSGAAGFDQKRCIFLTHVFAMRSTQKVEVINSDSVGHNAKISPARGATSDNFTVSGNSSQLYAPGGESPAPFPVTCTIHSWMKAWMITRDSPYFTVTDANGKFEIPKVPSGVELTFRVWQEKANYLSDVTLNGTPTKWKKGRFKVTVPKDNATALNVTVDASVFE